MNLFVLPIRLNKFEQIINQIIIFYRFVNNLQHTIDLAILV